MYQKFGEGLSIDVAYASKGSQEIVKASLIAFVQQMYMCVCVFVFLEDSLCGLSGYPALLTHTLLLPECSKVCQA